MSSRWTSILSLLLLISNLLVGFVQAATEDKTRLGNSTIDRTVQLRTHSLYAPYIDQDLQNRWWDFGADAYVNTYKHIRLTRNVPSQMGWLWSRLHLTAANFVIEAEFKITGDSSHLYGDGLALWLTADRAQPGPVFGSIDQFKGLGIFLDTYANGRHTYSFPRIVGILGDGKTKYDLANDGDSQAIGACSANFRRTNVATKLKITYVKDIFLDVKIQHKAWDDWSDCFFIKDISLPANPFLGFSAMTGDVSDAHDIISVTTYSAILTSPDSPRDKYSKPRKNSFKKSASEDEEEGSWLDVLFMLVLFGGVCAGGFYGYKEYQRRQRYGGRGGFGGLGMGGGDSFGNIYSNSKRF